MEQKHFVFFISQAGSSCSDTARQAADSGAPQGDVLSDLCSPSTPRASDNTPLSDDCYCGTSGTERLNTKVLQTGVSSAVGQTSYSSTSVERRSWWWTSSTMNHQPPSPTTTGAKQTGLLLISLIILTPPSGSHLQFIVNMSQQPLDAVVRAFMFPQDELLIILMFFPLMPSSGQNFYLSNTLIYEQITTKLMTFYTL